MGLYTLMKTGRISFTLTRVVYSRWLVTLLPDRPLFIGQLCKPWATTDNKSLWTDSNISMAKKSILKYVPECWKQYLKGNKISTFFSSAFPWILLGGAWCNASVFQLNTPSVQITHLSHFLMTTLLCWIKINSKQQLLPLKKRIHDVT